MTAFAYQAIRQPGEVSTGEIEAEDVQAATATLLARGYHVLSIVDANADLRRQATLRVGFMGGIRRREVVRFTRDLAHLLQAGLTLSQILVTLRSRAARPVWRVLLSRLRTKIEDGATLSEAFSAYPKVFNSMYVNLVRAGEESGKLVEVLTRLAELGEKTDDLRARVKMAMVYPAVMSCVGGLTVFVLVTFVVPMFSEVFRETGQDLPLLTQSLVNLSSFMSDWWWLVLPGLIATCYLLLRYVRTSQGRRAIGAISLRIPVLRDLVQKGETAAFARTMGTLISSGVPIVQALHTTATTLDNVFYAEAVRAMVLSVRDGELLSKAVHDCQLFPGTVSSIVAVGEQSGDLPLSLRQIAEENERDIDREIKVLMTLLEPAMIVFLGAIVGVIVLAMLLPIFSLGDSIQM